LLAVASLQLKRLSPDDKGVTIAGVYSSLGFALPLMDTIVCFQRCARGAQAVLAVELELDELKTELEFELDIELTMELDFELLRLLDLIDEIAFDDEVLGELLVV
jgi:hypothetical protein